MKEYKVTIYLNGEIINELKCNEFDVLKKYYNAKQFDIGKITDFRPYLDCIHFMNIRIICNYLTYTAVYDYKYEVIE